MWSLGKLFDQDSTAGYQSVTITTNRGVKFESHFEWCSKPTEYTRPKFYFICGSCRKQRLILRLFDNQLLCSECVPLPYKSRSVTKSKRVKLKRIKLLAKLGLSAACDLGVLPDDWARPKGMRRATYNRIKDEYHKLMRNDARKLHRHHPEFYDADDLKTIFPIGIKESPDD